LTVAAGRPYVDRAMTNDAIADRAAAHAVELWGLRPPVLLRRGMNALYVCGPIVLRVGNATAAPHLGHDVASVMRAHGVPTVAPIDGLAGAFDGVAVSAWERVLATEVPIDWVVVGSAVRRVHDVGLAEIPDGYPVPSPAAFPWWDFPGLIAEVADLIDAGSLRGIESTLRRRDGWQEAICTDQVLCHGDVHPGNVMATAGGPLLIDWDLLCRANPAWDHAMLTSYARRWGGDRDAYPAFADGYGASFADDPLTIGLADLRNVAATLMRVRAGRTNPAARREAERRLRYWRGEPDPPTWSAQ
jgi:hypothetical protein